MVYHRVCREVSPISKVVMFTGTAITCGWGDINGGSNQGRSMVVVVVAVVVVVVVVAGAAMPEVVVLAVVLLAVVAIAIGGDSVDSVRKD